MKRYEIAPLIGTGADGDPFRPDVAGPYVVIATRAGRCLIKRPVANGTAATATTIADLHAGEDDVRASTLTVAQRNTIKAWLTNNGFDIDHFDSDGVTNRRLLLRFVLRRCLQANDLDAQTVLHGFDVAEAG